MSDLILSLFPGIGLLDMAFEETGFCVVRGPDVLWGGDIKRFHPPPGRFDGVIGGPPCQAFSQIRYITMHNGYQLAANLIPEFERVTAEAQPYWFLMENVPGAPDAVVSGYEVHTFYLNNRWVDGATPQNRLRKFNFGCRHKLVNLSAYLRLALFEPIEYEYAVLASAGGKRTFPFRLASAGKPKRLRKNISGSRSVADCCRLQGLPENFLDAAPFTSAGKRQVLGNGVPLPMGRAVARAIRVFLETNHETTND